MLQGPSRWRRRISGVPKGIRGLRTPVWLCRKPLKFTLHYIKTLYSGLSKINFKDHYGDATKGQCLGMTAEIYKCVFSFWRNVVSDGADWTSAGRLFQSRGPECSRRRHPVHLKTQENCWAAGAELRAPPGELTALPDTPSWCERGWLPLPKTPPLLLALADSLHDKIVRTQQWPYSTTTTPAIAVVANIAFILMRSF